MGWHPSYYSLPMLCFALYLVQHVIRAQHKHPTIYETFGEKQTLRGGRNKKRVGSKKWNRETMHADYRRIVDSTRWTASKQRPVQRARYWMCLNCQKKQINFYHVQAHKQGYCMFEGFLMEHLNDIKDDDEYICQFACKRVPGCKYYTRDFFKRNFFIRNQAQILENFRNC